MNSSLRVLLSKKSSSFPGVRKLYVLSISALLLAAPAAAQQIVQPPATGPSAGRASGGANLGSAQLAAFYDGAFVVADMSKGVLPCEVAVGISCRLGAGQYEIVFTRDVSRCAYSVTNYLGTPRFFTAQPRGGKPNAVFILISDINGAAIGSPFYLTVMC